MWRASPVAAICSLPDCGACLDHRPRWGTGSQAASSSSSSRAPPTRTRGDDAALQAAWIAIGRGEDYVGPEQTEVDYLTDPRRRDLAASPPPPPPPRRQRCREGGSRSLLAGLRRYLDATRSTVRGEPLPPHLPCLPAHVLTYSRLACPWSQALDRRDGQHQVNLLFGLRRRAEPPEAAAAAPRRPVQQEAARGRCSRAEARWWPSVRASQRTQA